MNIVHLCDCMTFMKTIPDKHYDLAIVDPPYGININMNIGLKKGQTKKRAQKEWDKSSPSKEYFNELLRTSRYAIIWGGNYFILPPSRCFIIWDKGPTMYGRSFAECEQAWTNIDDSARLFKYSPIDNDRIHPTQKPVALYKWLLQKYARGGADDIRFPCRLRINPHRMSRHGTGLRGLRDRQRLLGSAGKAVPRLHTTARSLRACRHARPDTGRCA